MFGFPARCSVSFDHSRRQGHTLGKKYVVVPTSLFSLFHTTAREKLWSVGREGRRGWGVGCPVCGRSSLSRLASFHHSLLSLLVLPGSSPPELPVSRGAPAPDEET